MGRRSIIATLVFLGLVTAANTLAIFNSYQQSKKTVVVDVIKVFNEFKMKKDLEARVAVRLNEFSSAIDSMNAVYQMMGKEGATSIQLSGMSREIDSLKSKAQRAYVVSDKNINEQVWVRLNSLINEYGEKYGYVLVIGANGMGTVLYNTKQIDKTDELVQYINTHYETGH